MTAGDRAEFVVGSPVFVDTQQVGTLEQLVYSPAQRRVTALVIGKGILFHEDILVPSELVIEASEQGVRLKRIPEGIGEPTPFRESQFVQPPEGWEPPKGIERRRVLFALPGWHGPTALVQQAGARDQDGRPVIIGPKTQVLSHAGTLGHVLMVMQDSSTGEVTHVVVQSRPLLGREIIVPLDWASKVTEDEIFIEADREQLMRLPQYRPDQEILADVWEALWSVYAIRSLGLDSIEVEVKDGVVTLKGNIASPSHRFLAVRAASQVAGVLRVADELVADDDLEAAVARQLAQDERLAKLFIRVDSDLGVVSLFGTVPSEELAQRAIDVASRTPGVRRVVNRLQVS